MIQLWLGVGAAALETLGDLWCRLIKEQMCMAARTQVRKVELQVRQLATSRNSHDNAHRMPAVAFAYLVFM